MAKPYTQRLIEVTLNGDPTVSDLERESVIAVLNKNQPPSLPEFIKQCDVARILSVSRQTVREMVRNRSIQPVYLTPTLIRYYRKDIEALATERESPT